MHKSLLLLHIFLTLLLISTAHTFTMLVPFTMLLPHEKPSENQYYIPTFLQQRLSALPLLLEEKPRPPFDFLQLLPELQTRAASFATPQSMSNLSVTCKSLHEKLTFQTPGIWNIVVHSIDAISDEKLPELLLKAHLCAETTTEENKKLFYLSIKKKILSYDIKPYQCQNRVGALLSFDPFSPNCSTQLIGACYTGDKNIVDKMHKKNESLSNDDIENLFDVTIHYEKINIIPLLCTWHASRLERAFQSCKLHITYDNPAHMLNWHNFLANNALFNNKRKAFETMIMYYQKYLNIVDKNRMKYLDFMIHDFGHKDVNFRRKKDYQEYGKIVMKYGGTGNEKTMKIMNESNK